MSVNQVRRRGMTANTASEPTTAIPISRSLFQAPSRSDAPKRS